jgi:anthranilate phosphoribosyltransferase
LYSKKDIVGGTPDENAKITLSILEGKERGAKRDIVLLNSGIALYACEKAGSIGEGVKLAEESVDSGKALAKLKQYVEMSNS